MFRLRLFLGTVDPGDTETDNRKRVIHQTNCFFNPNTKSKNLGEQILDFQPPINMGELISGNIVSGAVQ